MMSKNCALLNLHNVALVACHSGGELPKDLALWLHRYFPSKRIKTFQIESDYNKSFNLAIKKLLDTNIHFPHC